MNPFEVITQILSLPFRLVNQMVQSVPPPPGLPPLPLLGGDMMSSQGFEFPGLPAFAGLPGSSSSGGTAYKNHETWTVMRDPKTNRMSGMKIVRNARSG